MLAEVADWLVFGGGLALLLAGGDRLVAAATVVAARAGVSPLVTGVLVVGLGTSLPELITSVDAALQGSPGLAIGNVVGSNIANVLLVLGLGALCVPFVCEPRETRRDLPCLIGASVLVLLLLRHGTIERWMGLVLIAALVAYFALLLATSRPQAATGTAREVRVSAASIARGLLPCGLWLAVLVVGAHGTVIGALGIADRLGVPDDVVGLTLVAIGTSLPELAVTVAALMRGSAAVALGNIVGSGLFNLLGILGVTALVSPLAVPAGMARFDAWVMLATVLVLACSHARAGESAVARARRCWAPIRPICGRWSGEGGRRCRHGARPGRPRFAGLAAGGVARRPRSCRRLNPASRPDQCSHPGGVRANL